MKLHFSFSKKITILLISLSLLTIIVISSASISIMEKTNTAKKIEHLETLTKSTYNQIDSAVNSSVKNYLRAVAEKNLEIIQNIYIKFETGELSEYEAKLLVEELVMSQSIGETGYIYIIDSIGVLQVHPFFAGKNINEYDFVMNQIDQKNGYLNYMWKNPTDLEEQEKVLYMTYFEPWDYIISVSTYKSEFIHLVNIEDFRDNILDIPLDKTGYIYVLDSVGKLIIHPSQEGVNVFDSVDSKGNYFVREIIHNKKGMIIYPWINPGEVEKRDKIAVYDYYAPMDWYINSGAYIDELSELFVDLKYKLFILALIIIVITVIISMVYSKIIMLPIRKLIKAMDHVKRGNYDYYIESKSKDEIGELTNIYNDMISTIKVYTDDLEKKVKERTQALELLSNSDGLTGIANRRKLDNFLEFQLSSCKRTQQPISIIMIDIDNFKNYNDSYGHIMGDEALIKVTTRINSVVNRSTDLFARYGGEEFVVVLSNTEKEGAINVCLRIQQALELLAINHESSPISSILTVSMGIATKINTSDMLIQQLYETADKALYIAKENGKNQFHCL